MSSVISSSIPRGGIDLAAHLHVPNGFSDGLDGAPLPAVVLATPGSSVKEQIGATYARRLADRDWVAVTFDPAFQGESSGEPRDLEDPAERVADLRRVVDHLRRRPGIDPQRLGVLGICAGGGYAVRAAMTDHRLRALGTVVASDIGGAFRAMAAATPAGVAGTLDALAAAPVDVADGEGARQPWLPDTVEDARAAGVTDVDLLQAVAYYRTPRGHHPRSTNRRHVRSDPAILGFDAFHLADQLLTQPVQVVVAGEAGTTGSRADGERLARLAPAAEEVLVVEGARHYEMYDVPAYVDRAVDRLAVFFAAHLT
ncbi:alpha/beta hydrolase [Actinomycetospora lemnae]|uniref:Alpha/beta hydrolase n=1 Tax=Actinomycetospora lemnae TaxID=3019891 RepID=A0ABT5SR71_9PSEU|nr:alpha/beta hydrolase [Actinomycetospora sp. DW7H6]MDD7965352.1 alpha/beta hydrolase [Actinomycetospora sp. DW7H6]